MADGSADFFMGASTQIVSVTPLLKSWNHESFVTDIDKCKTSNDGELIALLTGSHVVHVTHVSLPHEKNNIVGDVNSILWGICDWKNGKNLTYPTNANYLITTGVEHDINIFSFLINGEQFHSSLVTSIEPCLLQFDEEVSSIHDVSVVCSLHNIDGSIHQLICIINKMYLVQIVVSPTEESYVAKKLLLDKLSDKLDCKDTVKKHYYKDGVVFLLTENLFLYMFTVTDFQLLNKISIYEKFQLYDVLYFGISHSADSYLVTLITIDNQLNFLTLPSIKSRCVSERCWSHTDLWKDMLKHTKTAYKLKQGGYVSGYDKSSNSSTVLLPDWMTDFRMIDFHMSNTNVLLVQENIQNTKQRIVTNYNSIHHEFVFYELLSENCIAFCWNDYYPMLAVSSNAISIPTFTTTQEELIDKIIQYSDIHLAEKICNSNKWDQFSIPLHTLEIGLQQRQLDVVNFFLKSREKAFSHYWEELKHSFTNNDNGVTSFTSSSDGSENSEMIDAIEMVIKALHSNSKGKHKQNFFEGLLRVTIVYLNGLINDASVAMEIKKDIDIRINNSSSENMAATADNDKMVSSTLSNGSSSLSSSSSTSFLYDISDSVRYLTHKLIELRVFLRYPIEEDRLIEESQKEDVVLSNPQGNPKPSQANHDNVLMERENRNQQFLEDHLTNGKIATLQMLLSNQGRDSEAKLSNILKVGRTTVHEMLKGKSIEKAEKILRNMGLDSDMELKGIYLKTDELQLRDLLYTVLKGKRLLNEQDVDDYMYVKEVEELYRGGKTTSANNNDEEIIPIENGSTQHSSKEEPLSENNGSNTFCQFPLESVKYWDKRKRRLEMLDAIFINDAKVTIGNEYSTELWDYLISNNQIPILQTWIESVTTSDPVSCNQLFPDLPEDMPLEYILDEARESLVNLLVKNGYYPECIMVCFPDLLHYLGANNILFSDVHPMMFYKKTMRDKERGELVDRFNNDFMCFCQENELVMIMWHFICQYNISLPTITMKEKIKPWLSMMLSFHDVAVKWEDSSDDQESMLFAAFSENARYLIDESADCSSPYTLNDMLQNNQPILALACVLVCQNKFQNVFTNNEGNISEVDKKLLEEALLLYPELHDAVMDGDSKNTAGDTDVDMYKLLQDNTELDVSRWFCWQPKNSVAGEGDNILRELPHFSSSSLRKYAQEVTLDHTFYLEQGRPMYAYLVYRRNLDSVEEKQYLTKDAITSDTYRLGMENFNKLSVVASCLFFLDLLDVENEKLKTDARVAINITKYWNRLPADLKKVSTNDLKNYLVECFLEEKSNYLKDILYLLECTTELVIQENKVKRLSYEAVWYWDLVLLFCRIHKLPLSTHYIRACCEEDDWLQLFLFINLYQINPEQVVNVIEGHMENRVLRDHIIAIVRNIKSTSTSLPNGKQDEKHKKRKSKEFKTKGEKRDIRSHLYSRLGSVNSNKEKSSKDRSSSTASAISSIKLEEKSNSTNTLSADEPPPLTEVKDFTLPEAESVPDNVIDIILICDTHETPWKSLLAYGLVLFNEVFPPLAACYEDAHLISCQCVWYICSVSDDMDGLMLSLCKDVLGTAVDSKQASLALYEHDWTIKDLLVLVRGVLKRGIKYAKLVVQGFKIFRENDICIYILEFFQLFIFDEDPPSSLKKLKQFQSEYEVHRKKFTSSKESGCCFKSEDDVTFCEEFANDVIEGLMSLCKRNYSLCNLVAQLVESKYGRNFSTEVPNYSTIQKTIVIIYKSDIHYPVSKMKPINIHGGGNLGFTTEHINDMFDCLLTSACFDEATEFAQLHCLPQSKITKQKVVHDLNEMKTTRSWKVLSTRYAFMNKVDKTFFNSKCSCNLAASFFEDQAASKDPIYTSIERSYLLLLAMQWYQSSMIEGKNTKVRSLEKQVWLYQIKAEMELKKNPSQKKTALIRYSLKASEIPDIHEAFFHRTCSSIALVTGNGDVTELLQEMKYEEDEGLGDALISDEEEYNAFDSFICKLLDRNCITEARRVSSYFKRSTMDLEIVLAGIYLAQGNQTVDALGEHIKAILAATTSRHITISALMERSGSFTRTEPIHSPVVPSAGCMTDFVFIEEIQNALEKLTLRVKCGKKCLQKVLVSFKIATMLCLSYEDAVTEDYFIILQQVLAKGIDQRRQLSKQFIKAFDLPSDEVSKFVAETMTSWIKASCGIDIEDESLSNKDFSLLSSRTFDDIVSLLQLTEDPAQVGKLILEEMIRLSKANRTGSRTATDLTCEVELLIYAHHCFTISCEMEGIARILHFAGLCTKALARLQLHSQMVRLLTGIGRFNEMVYVIETLYNQHHFELLCKQGHLKEKQLKTSLLDFLRKYHPRDHESFGVVAHAFGMYREMAKRHETTGLEKIEKIRNEILTSNKEHISTLKDIKETFTCAADYYVKEECLRHAQKCIRTARLAELQLQLLPAGHRVLGLTPRNIEMFLREHKNFLESYVVADSYDLSTPSCWVDPLYHIVILNGNFNYLQQYETYFQITPSIAAEIASIFRKEKNVESSANMKNLLSHVTDLKTKLRLAHELNFTDMKSQLLSGTAGAYLRDQEF